MKILLNDILNLYSEDINNTKIGLNMEWNGKSHFSVWYESDPDNRDVDFTYHSHQANNRNFTKIGQLCFGFVRLDDDPEKWLLISAGKITSIPDSKNQGPCGHVEIDKYKPLLGRLIVKYHKPNTFSRYIFNANNLIDKLEVVEILNDVYEPIKFNGIENVQLTYKTLKMILDGHKYSDYKSNLMNVKGVYCLTDTKTGKLYIGSATGRKGVLQRWNDYLDTKTGGNKGLIDLYGKKGEKYFEDNFQYTLIESFASNVKTQKVLDRENYWKKAFCSKEFGYNKN